MPMQFPNHQGLYHRRRLTDAEVAEAAIREEALAAARESLGPEDVCHTAENAEYGGDFVVKWGEFHLKVGCGGGFSAVGWGTLCRGGDGLGWVG